MRIIAFVRKEACHVQKYVCLWFLPLAIALLARRFAPPHLE